MLMIAFFIQQQAHALVLSFVSSLPLAWPECAGGTLTYLRSAYHSPSHVQWIVLQTDAVISLVSPGGRQYYVLSLHRDTPLDQQAAASSAASSLASQPRAPSQPTVSNGFDDGFAGLTLKGGKTGSARKDPVVPQQGKVAGAAYLLHQVPQQPSSSQMPE